MSKSAMNTRQPIYTRKLFAWQSARDSMDSDDVKRRGELYLPMPSGFAEAQYDVTEQNVRLLERAGEDTTNVRVHDAPFYHPNKLYQGYLQRARFPDLVGNTLRGLIGVATRKPAQAELPSAIAHMEEDATGTGLSLDGLYVATLFEVLLTGRALLQPGIDAVNNRTELNLWSAERFINWRAGTTHSYSMAIFQEMKQDAAKDIYESENVRYTYAWHLYDGETPLPDGAYTGTRAVPVGTPYYHVFKNENLVDTVVPNLQGTVFDEMPVYDVGGLNNDNSVDPSPLKGVIEIAYTIYRKDADLTNAQYMTCNPTLCISGVDEGSKVLFGSNHALILPDADAKAYFPNTDTSGLTHVNDTCKDLRIEAAIHGASVLAGQQRQVEAAETARIRESSTNASLVNVVENVGVAITRALRTCARVSGAADWESAVYKPPTNFSELQLTPQMLTALVGAWQNGLYSRESIVASIEESGYLPDGVSAEDELLRIAGEGPLEMVDDDDQ